MLVGVLSDSLLYNHLRLSLSLSPHSAPLCPLSHSPQSFRQVSGYSPSYVYIVIDFFGILMDHSGFVVDNEVSVEKNLLKTQKTVSVLVFWLEMDFLHNFLCKTRVFIISIVHNRPVERIK